MLACLVLTTMGRVLLQCERDTTLPLHFSRLALLLASLLQFATSRQDFVRMQLRNGLCAVVSVDTAASVASAVVYARDTPATGERARLTSLVVLREFLALFHETVERVVEQNRADAKRMAEAYTLTSALEGGVGGDPGDAMDGDECDGTMAPFVGFHHDVVRRLLEIGDVGARSMEKKGENVRVRRCYVMNGETGVRLVSEGEASVAQDPSSDSCVTHQLVKRAARALQLAFPVLHHTSLLNRASTVVGGAANDGLGQSNASTSATTLVLRFFNSTTANHDVVLQMFHYGIFAAVVHYDTGSGNNSGDKFRGRECELLRDGTLRRVLLSDPRGAPLAQLLHDACTSPSLAVHVGSDGAPLEALAAADQALAPWKLSATSVHPSHNTRTE